MMHIHCVWSVSCDLWWILYCVTFPVCCLFVSIFQTFTLFHVVGFVLRLLAQWAHMCMCFFCENQSKQNP